MVENVHGEVLSFLMSHVLSYPVRIEAGFVHTDETYRGEVVVERSEVSLGVGI